jgi:hypothetical protein
VRRSRTNLAASRSWRSAEWTATFNTRPSVSTRMCLFRPVTFLFAPKPYGSSAEPPFEPPWPCSSGAGTSATPAIGSQSIARRRSRSAPRGHSLPAGGRHACPAGWLARPAPTRHRSDRADSASHGDRARGDVQASTSSTRSPRFKCSTKSHALRSPKPFAICPFLPGKDERRK